MFLKDLDDKVLVVGNRAKGYCRGVAISLKSHAVKYLLCASGAGEADFTISTNAVKEVGEQISLSALRTVCPRGCAKIIVGRPVYSFDGVYLGKITDLAMKDFIATHLYTDQGAVYPVSAITASQDALLLKREQPFPLGQRIPAPLVYRFSEKKEGIITKSVLKNALAKGELIRLTLALSPFQIEA